MFVKEIFDYLGEKAVKVDDLKGNSMVILPEAGGLLVSLKLDHVEKIDGVKTQEDLNINFWGKSILLYPFPNRLKQGKFQFQGKTYQFPINDKNTGNALHGFGASQSLELSDIALSEKEAKVILTYSYHGKFDYYPWPFDLKVIYSLNSSKQFQLNLQVENTSPSKMPFGIGWHPYFLIQKEGDCTELKLPKVKQIVVDEKMIPTGERKQFEVFDQLKKIENFNFDTGFEIEDSAFKTTVQLSNCDDAPLTYWQENAAQAFNYLQVFIPPQRESIAFEPMSCNIDAFNNENGLWVLNPGEQRTLSCGVELA